MTTHSSPSEPGRTLSPDVASGVRYAAYLLRCWHDQGGEWPCLDGQECQHRSELLCIAAALDGSAPARTPSPEVPHAP